MTALSDELMRREFGAAKKWWRRLLGLQVIATLCTAAGTFAPSQWTTIGSTLLGLVSTAALFFLRKLADESYERAESIRRGLLFEKALGLPVSAGEAARLHVEATKRPSDDPAPIGDYYNSDIKPGQRRLAHHVWESAFFTSQLAKSCATLFGVATVGGAIIIALWLAALLMLPTVLTAEHARHWLTANAAFAASAAASLLGVFGLGILADLWRNFRSLAATSDSVAARCEALVARRSTTLPEVLTVVEDYNCSVARAAPIPTFVWAHHQAELTAAWDTVRKQTPH